MRPPLKIAICAFYFCASLAVAKTGPEKIYLDSTRDYPLGPNGPKRHFLLSNSVNETAIEIRSFERFEARLICDSPVTLKNKSLLGRKRSAKDIELKLRKSAGLIVPANVDHCELSFWSPEAPNDIGALSLIKDEIKYPFLKELNHRVESCRYQAGPAHSAQDTFFINSPAATCAAPLNGITLLNDSKDAFLTKIETLTGSRPDISYIENQDPYAPLDFSKAPKFDAIFLSTLLYRSDFSGVTLARILKFHAKRGAIIYIMGTGYMHGEKDQALLKELANYSANIRVQEYKYHSPSPWPKLPGQYISNYLRDMHMKMLVTLSSKDPSANTLITGGRNVHDGFVFSERPDFSRFPELNQFSPDEAYAYWQDLELKTVSKDLAKSVFAHLLKFWNRDIQSQMVMPISSPLSVASEVLSSDSSVARHFMSVPFADDHALEKLYVRLIDSSKNNIKLSTPYLRPTKAIMAAFKRAVDRGIDITIQTRIDLKGDTQAWLYEETNKAAINSLYDKVKLYEWTQDSILHTKMISIDDTVAFFGSVNLSRRSFVQDIEHGLLIKGATTVTKLNNLFEKYNAASKRIDERQSRKFWASIVIGILPNQF